MSKKHIVVIGLGGVGGYFGFKINEFSTLNNLFTVTFIARAETYAVVKKNGLTLLSPEHQNSVTRPNFVLENIQEIIEPDLVLVCVKEYDLENVCRQLKEVITTKTIVLPMMNGADIYDRMRSILTSNTILTSCVYVASHIKQKGIVEHKGKAGKLIFGKDPENKNVDLKWVIDLMSKSNIYFDFKEDAMIAIWTKFIFIASFGLVTAKHNSSIGTVCSDALQKEEARNIMSDIKTIATKKGIALDEHIIDKTFATASTFPPTTPTSFQLDVHSGKEYNELELFAGAIIKFGQELDIATPYTDEIYLILKNMTK